MRLMTCDHVGIRYDSHPVVKDVNLDLEYGDYLCIVGENGSGKSTLMKGLLGLVKTIEGKITYHGIKRTEIGYLPQQTLVQKDFPASVYEVVISGCLNRRGSLPFYRKEDRKRAFQHMCGLGVESLARKSYRELSGGQQRRVLLARALCATETLLMLDEPVAGLDPVAAVEMYDLLKKLNREEGVTIVMISHDVKSAMEYGNKILHMNVAPLFFGTTLKYQETESGKRLLGNGRLS